MDGCSLVFGHLIAEKVQIQDSSKNKSKSLSGKSKHSYIISYKTAKSTKAQIQIQTTRLWSKRNWINVIFPCNLWEASPDSPNINTVVYYLSDIHLFI